MTRLREHVQLRVSAIKHVGDAVEVQAIPPEISQARLDARAECCRQEVLAKEEAELEPSEKPASHKYRRRKYHELTVAELAAIAHGVNIQFRFRRDVAEENRVSVSLVSRVASKCKGGVAWLEEQRAKEATRVS